jgi:hypothetical protein
MKIYSIGGQLDRQHARRQIVGREECRSCIHTSIVWQVFTGMLLFLVVVLHGLGSHVRRCSCCRIVQSRFQFRSELAAHRIVSVP